MVEIVEAEGAGERVDEDCVGGCGSRDYVAEIELEEVGPSDYGFFVYIANYSLPLLLVRWVEGFERKEGECTRIRKMTETRKRKLATTMAFRRVDVARLMSTPGVYVGVNVRSDEPVSGPASPSELCSFWALISCLRAASDLKVGRAMRELTPCRESSNQQLRMERATGAIVDDEVLREMEAPGMLCHVPYIKEKAVGS